MGRLGNHYSHHAHRHRQGRRRQRTHNHLPRPHGHLHDCLWPHRRTHRRQRKVGFLRLLHVRLHANHVGTLHHGRHPGLFGWLDPLFHQRSLPPHRCHHSHLLDGLPPHLDPRLCRWCFKPLRLPSRRLRPGSYPAGRLPCCSKPLPPSPRSVSSLSRAKLTHTLSSTSLPRPSWAGLSSATTAPSLCLLAPPAVISLPRSKRRPSRFLFCSSFVFVLPYILTHTHT